MCDTDVAAARATAKTAVLGVATPEPPQEPERSALVAERLPGKPDDFHGEREREKERERERESVLT